MGATGWYYATPYDPDPEAALQRLRQDTFLAGDYQKPWEVFRIPPGIPVPWRLRALLAGLRAVVWTVLFPVRLRNWAARGFRGPRSIEEALTDAQEGDTHSVLDITHTADLPAFGAAVPLGRRKLLEYFGTTQPTLDQVNERLHDIREPIARWEAVYLTVYRDGEPHETLFIGCSGD